MNLPCSVDQKVKTPVMSMLEFVASLHCQRKEFAPDMNLVDRNHFYSVLNSDSGRMAQIGFDCWNWANNILKIKK